MSYTRPEYDSANATWVEATAYTRPAFDQADAFWSEGTSLLARSRTPLGLRSAALLEQRCCGLPREPFPYESRFGFTIVAPLDLTPTFTSAEDIPIPLWSSSACYARGEEVRTADGRTWLALFDRVEDRINACKPLYNINRSPASALIPASAPCSYDYRGYPWWTETLTVANPLRMFDGTLERETVAIDTLEVRIAPTTAINALCVFGLTASRIRVSSERYVREEDLSYRYPAYPSVLYRDRFIELDFPHQAGEEITLVFTGLGPNRLHPPGMIRVGMVVAGVREDVGFACYSTEVGLKDYSSKARDVFGMPVIREDAYSEWIRYSFEARTPELHRIKQLIARYRAQYVAYIGRDSRQETTIFGVFQDFTIPVETYSVSTGTLEVLGAPLAFHRPYDAVCPSSFEGETVFCDGATTEQTLTCMCGDAPNLLTGFASDVHGNTLEVGLNGALFFNGLRTPFSPLYTMNSRCAGYDATHDTFVIAGDTGFIATVSPEGAIRPRLSPIAGANYRSIAASPIPGSQSLAIVLLTDTAERVFSFDGGVTWILNEALAYNQDNFFDGVTGEVSFQGATAIHAYGNRAFLARTSALHYTTPVNGLWQTALNVPTTEPVIGIAAGLAGQVVLITRHHVLRTTDFRYDWDLQENLWFDALVAVHWADNGFFVSTADGMRLRLRLTPLEIDEQAGAGMGTLAPMLLRTVLNAPLEPGTPAG